MTKYFFDLALDGAELDRDGQGSDLPDLAAASREARQTVGDLFRDEMRNDSSVRTIAISVRDEAGTVVLCVQLLLSTEVFAGKPEYRIR